MERTFRMHLNLALLLIFFSVGSVNSVGTKEHRAFRAPLAPEVPNQDPGFVPDWEHGKCEQWPLTEGRLKKWSQLKLKGGGVSSLQPFYGILNAKYLSLFQNENDATACARPVEFIKVKDMLVIHPYTMQGKEDELTPPRYCFEVVYRPLMKLESTIFCSPSRRERHTWVARLKSQMKLKREMAQIQRHMHDSNVGYNDDDADDLASGGMPRVSPEDLFSTSAPSTICTAPKTGGGSPDEEHPAHCLSAAPGAANGGGAVALWPAKWSAGMPVRAVDDQMWAVQPVSDQPDEKVVTVCMKPEYGGLCLTIEPTSLVMKDAVAEPRPFTECHGNNLRCLRLKNQTLGSPPSPKNLKSCQDHCFRDARCTGWTHTRAGVNGLQYARCCLHTGPSPTTCEPNSCCSGGLTSDAVISRETVPTVEAEGVPGRITLMQREGDSGGPLQHWNIVAAETPGFAYLHSNATAPPPDKSSRCLVDNFQPGAQPTASVGIDVVLRACQPVPAQMWRLTGF